MLYSQSLSVSRHELNAGDASAAGGFLPVGVNQIVSLAFGGNAAVQDWFQFFWVL